MTENDVVLAKIVALKREEVRQWLLERSKNCRRIAKDKTGRDRDGWLDDAAYFAAAIGLIDWSESE